MAETVYLSDGTTEIIFDEKPVFLERLIREKLGDDAARCFSSYVSEVEEELKYTQESEDEKEKVADGYIQMCRDAMEQFSLIKAALNAPRLDRKKLTALAEQGFNDLYKNL
ncbi:MAG: hypothetical protein EOM30_01585 [Clostridia bacterium]|nr:hypothetical protein [Clostridia bacterium]